MKNPLPGFLFPSIRRGCFNSSRSTRIGFVLDDKDVIHKQNRVDKGKVVTRSVKWLISLTLWILFGPIFIRKNENSEIHERLPILASFVPDNKFHNVEENGCCLCFLDLNRYPSF